MPTLQLHVLVYKHNNTISIFDDEVADICFIQDYFSHIDLVCANEIHWAAVAFDISMIPDKLYESLFEQHDKTNKMTCVPSEDSDQPGHLHSLIRVFVVCMKKPWVLSYLLSAQRRLIGLGGSEFLLGAHHFVGFVARWLIWNFALFFLLAEICLDLNGYKIIDQLEEVIKKFNMNKVRCCTSDVVMCFTV